MTSKEKNEQQQLQLIEVKGGRLKWPSQRIDVWVHVQLFVTQWTVSCWAPLSMGFSMQEYWSGYPLPSPGDLPTQGSKPASPVCLLHCKWILSHWATREAPKGQVVISKLPTVNERGAALPVLRMNGKRVNRLLAQKHIEYIWPWIQNEDILSTAMLKRRNFHCSVWFVFTSCGSFYWCYQPFWGKWLWT